MSYDPATGRWLQQDPAEFDAGDPNLYRYVGNNPANDTDPTGLYNQDVHFYMTYYLALKAGLGKINSGYKFANGQNASVAYVIAWSAQYTDVNTLMSIQ